MNKQNSWVACDGEFDGSIRIVDESTPLKTEFCSDIHLYFYLQVILRGSQLGNQWNQSKHCHQKVSEEIQKTSCQ